VKDIKLDLGFLKKLYYYNKNLEDYIKAKMRDKAYEKHDEIAGYIVIYTIF
jgi:hypothetical protein